MLNSLLFCTAIGLNFSLASSLCRTMPYRRLQIMSRTEGTDEELRLQLAPAANDNGWDEAGMDAYDRYDLSTGRGYFPCGSSPVVWITESPFPK
jgi:hypothetical protein